MVKEGFLKGTDFKLGFEREVKLGEKGGAILGEKLCRNKDRINGE